MIDEKPKKQRRVLRTSAWLVAWPVIGLALFIAITTVNAAIRPTLSPGLRSVSFSMWDSGYVAVSGTWAISQGRLAAEVNHSVIECDAVRRECVEAVGELHGKGPVNLNVEIRNRPIESWTEKAITTRNEGACGTYVMTINRDTESVTALQTRPDNIGDQPTCSFGGLFDADKLEKRIEYRLIDGFKEAFARYDRDFSQTVVPFSGVVLTIWTLFVGFRVWRIWRAKAA